ncbi:MAG: glutamate--tRNA ligase [Holosporales bacterium]|jgi:glutamyl-tRNA synthetase|nr:glutamate--tRNA ligase [Holosporales bacterium]
MSVVTRFAPSPTGSLHLGSARTALFNWLFARHHKGTFLLRIEDTDRKRSTEASIKAIFEGLQWLDLDWDQDVVFQCSRAALHAAAAHRLVEEGKAYYCYATLEELENMRAEAKAKGLPPKYNGFWRDRSPQLAPSGVPPVIRLKVPQQGETLINDLVQGSVTVSNTQLDDMVLLRSDGTPTYMLSVVVDDHEADVTHVIRGGDHLTNTFRQLQLYEALGWKAPQFAHIPLIHGSDGAKLSKRHGAVSVNSYRDLGYLQEAICNCLLRLGWGHGDDEIITREQAIAWFDIDHVGQAPARFEFARLDHLNAHYMRTLSDASLLERLIPFLTKPISVPLSDTHRTRLLKGLSGLKRRAKTLVELAENALPYLINAPIPYSLEALNVLCVSENNALIKAVLPLLTTVEWTHAALETCLRTFASDRSIGFGKVAQPLRWALTGCRVSPSIFEVLDTLGRTESVARLKDACQTGEHHG